MKISAYAASVVAVLCLAVAGCSSDDEPGASSPTKSPSATVTTTDATPAPPELPAAAREKTRAGAAAFVSHYWDAVDFGMETGDLDALSTLSTPACRPCRLALQSTRKFFDAGGSQEGGSTTATVKPLIWDPRNGTATTFVRLATTAGTKSFGGANRRVEPFPATSYSFVMETRWMNGRWHVESMEAR